VTSPLVGFDQPGPFAGVVDEELVAGQVLLPHRQLALGEPGPVVLAELAVAIPVGVLLQVLDVEQLQRHAGLLASVITENRPLLIT
jgi:hypothetical protein